MSLLTTKIFQSLPKHKQTNVISKLLEKLPNAGWVHPDSSQHMDQDEKERLFRDSFSELMNETMEKVQRIYLVEQQNEAEEIEGGSMKQVTLHINKEEHPKLWENQLFLSWALFDRLHREDHYKHMVEVFTIPDLRDEWASVDKPASAPTGSRMPLIKKISKKSEDDSSQKTTAPKPSISKPSKNPLIIGQKAQKSPLIIGQKAQKSQLIIGQKAQKSQLIIGQKAQKSQLIKPILNKKPNESSATKSPLIGFKKPNESSATKSPLIGFKKPNESSASKSPLIGFKKPNATPISDQKASAPKSLIIGQKASILKPIIHKSGDSVVKKSENIISSKQPIIITKPKQPTEASSPQPMKDDIDKIRAAVAEDSNDDEYGIDMGDPEEMDSVVNSEEEENEEEEEEVEDDEEMLLEGAE